MPDTENNQKDIGTMQEDYLIERIGLTLYGALCEKEREEQNARAQHRVR